MRNFNNHHNSRWNIIRVPFNNAPNELQFGTVDSPQLYQLQINWPMRTHGVLISGFVESTTALFTAQLPNDYIEGTDIYPHFYWYTLESAMGVVEFELEYTWTNVSETVANNTALDAISFDAPSEEKILTLTEFSPIDGTGKKINSQLTCRLIRAGYNGAVDTWPSTALINEFCFRYQSNDIGSYYETRKG